VPVPERFGPVSLLRVVAAPPALDAVTTREHRLAIRIAPDETLLSAERSRDAIEERVTAVDPHAIVATDDSFAMMTMTPQYLTTVIRPALEWEWTDTSRVGLGLLHAVPICLATQVATPVATGPGELVPRTEVVLLCHRTLVHELEERLP
jgi:hypothetical protein